jgi:hypothetical protein
MARRAIQRRVAPRRPRRRMTGRIGLADIRLDFHDHAAGQRVAMAPDENFSEEITRDVQCGAVVERPGQRERRSRHDDHRRARKARRVSNVSLCALSELRAFVRFMFTALHGAFTYRRRTHANVPRQAPCADNVPCATSRSARAARVYQSPPRSRPPRRPRGRGR